MKEKIDKIIEILKEVRETIDSPDTNVGWSRFNSVEEFLEFIDSCILKLEKRDKVVLKDIKTLFAPTGSLQEISIDSGWSLKYIELANKVDELI